MGRSILMVLGVTISLLASGQTVQPERFRPGEAIRIVSDSEPTLSGTFVVASDGLVKLPLIGSFAAGGLTREEAERSLTLLYMDHGIEPGRLAVFRARLSFAPIAFGGAVRFSGFYPYRSGITLADVLEIAAPTESADLGEVAIEEQDGKRIRIDFRSGLKEGNPQLRPGDRVFVPLGKGPNVVVVLGAVEKPGNVAFHSGITVKQAVALAGGATGNGDRAKVVLERDGGVLDVINLEMNYNAQLRRGDVLRVPLVPHPKYVFVMGAVRKEGRYDFKHGMRLTQAISAAGGMFPGLTIKLVAIARRVDGNIKRTSIDLEAVGAGRIPDPELRPGDILELFPGRPGKGR